MIQNDRPTAPQPPSGGAGRFIVAVFGFVFAGIGVTVLIFMWGTSRDGFGAPPLFFRIFASFIAVAFVAMGGTMGVAALRNASLNPPRPPNGNAANLPRRGAAPPIVG